MSYVNLLQMPIGLMINFNVETIFSSRPKNLW